ncbi:RNA-binding protein [Candidatus Poribacteria bacterium]|nr:RNA-binding protein [Candidatus Poribacteria bacterium]
MGRRLYVGNLNYRTTEDVLGHAFAEFGNVMDVTVIEGKGFGFVEMETDEDATKAREGLNGSELDGRTIRVDEARPRPERGAGGPRGGGGYGGGGGFGGGGRGGGRDRW